MGREIKYSLRPANEDDEEFLRTLREQCYREVVIAQFGEWDDDVQCGFFSTRNGIRKDIKSL